jgi:dihydrofolate reductase
VAGGAEIYARAMAQATRLAITQVHLRAAGEVRFPSIDATLWHEISRSEHAAGDDDDSAYAFVDYERTTGGLPA